MEWQYRNNAFERNTEIHDSKPKDRLEETGISYLLSRGGFLTRRSFAVRNGNIWNAREEPYGDKHILYRLFLDDSTSAAAFGEARIDCVSWDT